MAMMQKLPNHDLRNLIHSKIGLIEMLHRMELLKEALSFKSSSGSNSWTAAFEKKL
jgi:hypothetical protein